jgi:hypothetical protein
VPRYALSDANIMAISLVKHGANRKRYYLRKSTGEVVEHDAGAAAIVGDEELRELGLGSRIVKADDWSTVYCVVAEPGWIEGQGVGDVTGDNDDDVWASADEIRKAAHQFMRNGALINHMHKNLEPFGEVVENFVAPADIYVDGEVIKSGAWCIGICPSEEGRVLIENGELGGVSIQGDARRDLMAKARVPLKNDPNKTNWVERTGGFPKELRALMEELKGNGKPDDEAIAEGISVGRKYAAGKAANGTGKISQAKAAKWKAVMARYEAQRASTHIKKDGPMNKLMKAMAAKLGLDPDSDEFRDELEKSTMTFSQIIGRTELCEEMPEALDALREALYNAYYPLTGTSTDPSPAEIRAALSTSLDEFGAYMLDLYDGINSGTIKKSEEEMTAQIATLRPISKTLPEEDQMDTAEMTTLLKSSLTEALEPISTRLTAVEASLAKAELEKPPTAEELATTVTNLTAQLAKAQADIAKLGDGDSSLNDGDDSDVDPELTSIQKVRKGYDPHFSGALL